MFSKQTMEKKKKKKKKIKAVKNFPLFCNDLKTSKV